MAADCVEYEVIKYEHIFGENTSLLYNTTYNGYKEIIELKSRTNENTYQFVLDTGTLLPEVSEMGEIRLLEPKTKECKASFAPLYVYDSSSIVNFTTDNSYELLPLEDGQYCLKLTIDKSFLCDPNIVYPVYIDPTFSFGTASSIDDASVYSGRATTACGTNYYNHVGYIDSTNKIAYLLVKFPALKSSALFNGWDSSKITSVTYNVRKVGGGAGESAILGAYRYTGSSWTDSSVTYSSANVDSNTGALICSQIVSTNKWYSFPITSTAKAWKNGTASYDSGIVIKNLSNNTSADYVRTLAAVEYGETINDEYMPYVAVVFNNSEESIGYTTADLAAKNFAQCVYSSSEYVRIEYAATMYKKDGKYYYYNVHSGEPHEVIVSKVVPTGATLIGYIHTHPNSEYFSNGDKNIAESWGKLAYVVTPSHTLKKYDSTTDTTSTVNSGLSLYKLTSAEKTALVNELRTVWEGHFVDGVCSGFHCEDKTWPNE